MTDILLNVFYVLIAIAMIVLILLQRGAGAQAGSGFGAGASGTVFGARGSANFLSSTTKYLAVVFFALSLFMAYQATHRNKVVFPDPEGPTTTISSRSSTSRSAPRSSSFLTTSGAFSTACRPSAFLVPCFPSARSSAARSFIAARSSALSARCAGSSSNAGSSVHT